jgi:hypothetical protein
MANHWLVTYVVQNNGAFLLAWLQEKMNHFSITRKVKNHPPGLLSEFWFEKNSTGAM